MRCYHLNNFYMGGIHAGIQSAHAQHELAMKYLGEYIAKSPHFEPAKKAYIDWATNYKTIIVLNAGMQSDLKEWVALMQSNSMHDFAWAPFYESDEAINGALTNMALVLPERIYGYAREVSKARAMESNHIRVVRRIHDGAECRYYNTDAGGKLVAPDGDELAFTDFELQVMLRLSKCNLM